MDMYDSESAARSRVCNMDTWEDDMNEQGTRAASISRVMTDFSSPEPNTNAKFANVVIQTMRKQPGNDDKLKPNQGEDPELREAGYGSVETTRESGTKRKHAPLSKMVTLEFKKDVWFDMRKGHKNSVKFRRLRSTALNTFKKWLKDPKFSKNNASRLVLPTHYNKDVLDILEGDKEFAERVKSELGFYKHGSHVYLENRPMTIDDAWTRSKMEAISAMISTSDDPKVSEKSSVSKKRRLDAKKTEQKVDAETTEQKVDAGTIECPCSPSLVQVSGDEED